PLRDLVFKTKYGNPLEWSSLRASYYRICERAKLGSLQIRAEKEPRFKPLLKPYALRHTHATLELEDGVPLEVVSARLGHSDAYFTAKDRKSTRLNSSHVAISYAVFCLKKKKKKCKI